MWHTKKQEKNKIKLLGDKAVRRIRRGMISVLKLSDI